MPADRSKNERAWVSPLLQPRPRSHFLLISRCTDAAISYEEACTELGWTLDPALAASMRAATATKLTSLDAAVEDARENAGDVEVRDALAAKAAYICDTGAEERWAGMVWCVAWGDRKSVV